MEPHTAAFYFTVRVPPIADHSWFLQTSLCSTCTPLVTLLLCALLNFHQIEMSSSTKSCITDFLILCVFSVHDHVLKGRALGAVFPCGPLGAFCGGWFW